VRSLALGVLTVMLTLPRVSRACTCAAPVAKLLWPAGDSSAVPTGGTLVVFSSDGANTLVRLTDAAGRDVPVDKVRTLDASEGCGGGLNDVVLVRPPAPLAPSTRYTLELTFPPREGQTVPSFARTFTFTTGTSARVAPPSPTLKSWLFAQDFTWRGRLLQAYVQADGPEPSFVVAKGKPATLVMPLGPINSIVPAAMPLGEVECGELEHIDVTGKTLAKVRLCQPEACITDTEDRCDTCGGNCGGHSIAEWQAAGPCPVAADALVDATTPDAAVPVPDASVGAMPDAAEIADALAPRWPDAAPPMPATPAPARRTSGCSLGGGAGGPTGLWLMLGLLLARRARLRA
jgi:hypothetical protein